MIALTGPQDLIVLALYALLGLLFVGVLVLMAIPILLLLQVLLHGRAPREPQDGRRYGWREIGRAVRSSSLSTILPKIKRYFWCVWLVYAGLLVALVVYGIAVRAK